MANPISTRITLRRDFGLRFGTGKGGKAGCGGGGSNVPHGLATGAVGLVFGNGGGGGVAGTSRSSDRATGSAGPVRVARDFPVNAVDGPL
ncbi:hypothetical protein AB3Y40_05865 [Yoonia sp. R2331]|uniref:hypothetical protein n=1 Tax=Yoonia sp. R2331 TaxID=3237238 RepID=UPI0034E5A7B3